MAARIALPQDSSMSLRNMNIAPRAFLGFAFIGALMLLLGVFALNQMSKIRAATEDITSASVPSIRALDEFTQLTLRLRVLSYRLLTNREPDVQQKTLKPSRCAISRFARPRASTKTHHQYPGTQRLRRIRAPAGPVPPD